MTLPANIKVIGAQTANATFAQSRSHLYVHWGRQDMGKDVMMGTKEAQRYALMQRSASL